ncbi:MAG: MBL fold metallo-hydrolase [Anaerolineae bacterium]|nr:MBL fold metallo-hydrolase [Anaerolineae bacterium]
MEITWYGHSCFRLTERSMLTVVTDPYESKKDALKLKADAVTISKDSPAHNNVNAVVGAQRGDVRIIRGPGEYEMGGVFITGVPMKPAKKEAAGTAGASEKCTVYAFNYEGVNVVHLGSLSFVPTQSQIDALETVDVLLVPVGEGLNGAASLRGHQHDRAEHCGAYAYDGDHLTKFLKETGPGQCQSPRRAESDQERSARRHASDVVGSERVIAITNQVSSSNLVCSCGSAVVFVFGAVSSCLCAHLSSVAAGIVGRFKLASSRCCCKQAFSRRWWLAHRRGRSMELTWRWSRAWSRRCATASFGRMLACVNSFIPLLRKCWPG